MKGFSEDRIYLSNFYPVKVEFEGLIYPSVEAAFQAAKTLDINKRIEFVDKPPAESKRMGRQLRLRSDWNEVRLGIMESLVRQKFQSHPELLEKLSKEISPLVEWNYWHDNFWGRCSCSKCQSLPWTNHLGRILDRIAATEKEPQLTITDGKYGKVREWRLGDYGVMVGNLSKVPNKTHPAIVYIGRRFAGLEGSVLQNPFKEGKDGTREEIIKKYEASFLDSPGVVEEMLNLLQLLKAKGSINLGCWCSPLECHGDVIAKTLLQELFK